MFVRVFVAGIGLILTLLALLIMIWSVVPAPNYRLFMVSVGGSEWSVWVGGIALIGMGLGGVALGLGSPRLGSIALVCGFAAVALAAKPPAQAWQVAAREDTPLSLRRYLFGIGAQQIALEETRDVQYAEVGGQALRLDIYRPAARSSAALPAVVVIHGGSWRNGAKGEFVAMSRALAREGRVVFDINYRLATPEQPFPAQIADVKCALGWVKANAPTYGVDPARVAVLGRSAGGQLALLAAYTPNDPRLPPSCPADDTSVRAVIAFYAPVDLAWGYDHPLRPDVIRGPEMLRNYLGGPPATQTDRYRLASPNMQVTASSPPTLLIHGENDRLVGIQHSRLMAEALQRVGLPYRFVILPWANHGFDFAPDGWGSQIAEAVIREFLGNNL